MGKTLLDNTESDKPKNLIISSGNNRLTGFKSNISGTRSLITLYVLGTS